MRTHFFEIALAIGLAVSLISASLAMDTQKDISGKLIRLHIIANSDSETDQKLKLEVRDEILKHISSITRDCRNIDEARTEIEKKLSDIENLTNNIVSEKGFEYTSSVELSEAWFPTKNYDDFSLPAGKYEALRIKLGNAKGKNWWCVLFPPVCVSAAEAENEFKSAGLSDDEINFVMSDKVEYRFKFKIVEIIENITEKI